MTSRQDAPDIGALLRAADPLADDEALDAAQWAAIRHRVIERAVSAPVISRLQLAPTLSTATLLIVALAVAWWPETARPPGAPAAAKGSPAATGSEPPNASAREERRIHFETPGGTIVVWVLDPKFPS